MVPGGAPATPLDSGPRGRDSVLDSPLTQTGVLIGTPAYMAPEQFSGRVPDPKSDQFAFCVTAWEAFTGARPFRGATLEELEAAARGGVRDTAADLPPPIRAVLVRGLDPDPEARWPDVPALLAALGDAVAAPVPRRGRAKEIAAAAAVLALAGGTILLTSRSSSSNKTPKNSCANPEATFASAYGETQRAALRENRGGAALGAIAILEETKRTWLEMFRATCAAPRSTVRETRLQCLLSARDEVASTVRSAVAKGQGGADPTVFASLAVSVVMCDPSHANFHDPDDPESPTMVPPVPPVLPVPEAPESAGSDE